MCSRVHEAEWGVRCPLSQFPALFLLRQGLSLNLELADLARLASLSYLLVSTSPVLGLELCTAPMGDGELNSGPHALKPSIFLTELFL